MKEIGGEFHLTRRFQNTKPNQTNRLVQTDVFFTSSGRDSLFLTAKILNLTSHDEILLPSYLCPEILKSYQTADTKYRFYKVNRDLSVDLADIEKKIKSQTKAVLVIHYFGFPQNVNEIKQICKNHLVFFIEDNVQSFMSSYEGSPLGYFGDISINSYRKYLSVLDGSLLRINNDEVELPKLKYLSSLQHFNYLLFRYLGTMLHAMYLYWHIVPKSFYLGVYSIAEHFHDKYPRPAKISGFSMRKIQNMDFDTIKSIRRGNFQFLLNNWPSETIRPLFSVLPENVCPLGFPILTKNRDEVKQKLIYANIYPPIHWKLPSEVEKNEYSTSWDISNNILTIPIDQRYDIDDMKYIIDQIKVIDSISSNDIKL